MEQRWEGQTPKSNRWLIVECSRPPQHGGAREALSPEKTTFDIVR